MSLGAPGGIPHALFPVHLLVLPSWKGDEGLIAEANFRICGEMLHQLPLTTAPHPATLIVCASPAAVPRSPSRCHCDPGHPHRLQFWVGARNTFVAWGTLRGGTSPLRSPTGRVLSQREGPCLCFTLFQDHFREWLWFSEGSTSWSRG